MQKEKKKMIIVEKSASRAQGDVFRGRGQMFAELPFAFDKSSCYFQILRLGFQELVKQKMQIES